MPADGDAIQALIQFLKTGDLEFVSAALGRVSRERAAELLREWIPAEIQLRGHCTRLIHGVVSAPHAGFDHWSEHYCNRLAPALKLGWVVALNYRDRDRNRVPLDIGRHLHVNRPTETLRAGQAEVKTERAENVFRDYVSTLRAASLVEANEPLDLLIEIHAHRKSNRLEIATVGLSLNEARELKQRYLERVPVTTDPDLLIEPLDELHWKAAGAKAEGILQATYVRRALHIELPRQMRLDETVRAQGVQQLIEWLVPFVDRLERTT